MFGYVTRLYNYLKQSSSIPPNGSGHVEMKTSTATRHVFKVPRSQKKINTGTRHVFRAVNVEMKPNTATEHVFRAVNVERITLRQHHSMTGILKPKLTRCQRLCVSN